MVPGVGARVPCAATYRTVLPAVEAEHVNEILMALLPGVRAATREPGEQEHVAVDGKTVRGRQKHEAEDHKKRHPVCV